MPDPLKIGVLSTLVGPFAVMGEDGMRGAELAVAEFGGAMGDRPITLFKEGSNAIPDSAIEATQKLIETEDVDFMVGPLSGNEGLAVRDYAHTRPAKTFLNGCAGTQDITLRNPAPNFFSFSTNGVQWMAGLGTYAYEVLGYRHIVTVAENYSYPHSQIGGLMLEFCAAGGSVVKKVWAYLGTTNYNKAIGAIPEGIDAIFVALAGGDAVNFLQQYVEGGGHAPLLAGPGTVDQTVLGIQGALSERIVGIVSSGPTADDNPDPAWQHFVSAYREYFPGALPSPSLVAYCYYVNMKAGLLALHQVDGDLSDGQVKFQEALANLAFDSPTGPVRLDHNRAAIATIFVSRVEQQSDGTLYTRMVQAIPEVNSTLGFAEDDFLAFGPFTAENPECP